MVPISEERMAQFKPMQSIRKERVDRERKAGAREWRKEIREAWIESKKNRVLKSSVAPEQQFLDRGEFCRQWNIQSRVRRELCHKNAHERVEQMREQFLMHLQNNLPNTNDMHTRFAAYCERLHSVTAIFHRALRSDTLPLIYYPKLEMQYSKRLFGLAKEMGIIIH